MSNHNGCYTTVTLSVKQSWLGPIYQLLADLSADRKTPTLAVDKPEEQRTSYIKLGKLPSLVARHCECGKCHGKLQGSNRSPWRTTYVGFYRASDGKEYQPCKSLLDAVRKGAPRTLVGFIYHSDSDVDDWREKVDRTKASYTLDKLESERQLRAAKLNSVVVDTTMKMGELKASDTPKADLPKLVKVAPLKDATDINTVLTKVSDKRPPVSMGVKPKVPRPTSNQCISSDCTGLGIVSVPGGFRCWRCDSKKSHERIARIEAACPDPPLEETKDNNESWFSWRRKNTSWNDYKPGSS